MPVGTSIMKNYKMLVLVLLFPSASLSQTEASLFTISHYLSYTYHLGSATADWASLVAQIRSDQSLSRVRLFATP